eukprot:c2764_g1_i1.p1 GENE.c2764_g1_i1~~c2764_g1_i1.p1  ORF type:complete len:247 (-),score=69.41 c2764_g1_i1:41-781(-)
MSRTIVLASVLVAAVLALPTASTPKSQMANFLPLVSEIISFTGAVIPTAMTKKFKHSHDFEALVQMSAQSNNAPNPFERVPDGKYTVDMMIAMGDKIKPLVGYNPMDIVTNLLGKDGFAEIVNNVTKFATEFPDTVTEDQVQHAEMVLLTLGVFGPDSAANMNATQSFMQSLTAEQSKMMFDLEHSVLERLMNAMVNADGTPSQALVDEMEREMKAMEASPGMHLVSNFLNIALVGDDRSNIFRLL